MGGEAYSELQCLESEDGRKKDAWPGGGFKDFLFSPLLGEDSHFD